MLPMEVPEEYEQPVHDLWMSYDNLTAANMRESLHDAQVALDLCMNLFSGGYLPLEQRVRGREPVLCDLPSCARHRNEAG